MENIIGVRGDGPERGPAAGGLIKDSDEAQFRQDVIEASRTTPVIVDFWAPWCGPCKQLGPALEKAVQGARGAVRMVKVNIDENQRLAAQLRIQSIPAVYAFFQGQPIDGFVGAQPESAVKAFVDRLAKDAEAVTGPSPLDVALDKAQAALDAGQPGAAASLFGQVLKHEPDNETALAGMIRCRLASGDGTAAQKLFDSLPEARRGAPAFTGVAAALELAAQGAEAGEVSALRRRVTEDPSDLQARFDLAIALHAAGEREAAAEALLEIVRRNRTWNEDAARKQLVKFFEAWGAKDPLTLSTRRQLSSLLFA